MLESLAPGPDACPGACHARLNNMLCLGFTDSLETEGLETEGLKTEGLNLLHSVPCPALQHPVLASLSEA